MFTALFPQINKSKIQFCCINQDNVKLSVLTNMNYIYVYRLKYLELNGYF